jgi:hypothetical protein
MLFDWALPLILLSLAFYSLLRRETIIGAMRRRSERTAHARRTLPGPLKGAAMRPRTAYLYYWTGVLGAVGAAIAFFLASFVW